METWNETVRWLSAQTPQRLARSGGKGEGGWGSWKSLGSPGKVDGAVLW